MILRFSSGSGDAGEPFQEHGSRVLMDKRDVVVPAEEARDLLGLALAHEAGVDEHAGELRPDRLVQQDRDPPTNPRRPTGRK